MTPRQKALTLGSPALAMLLVCGAWQLGQKAVDLIKDGPRIRVRF